MILIKWTLKFKKLFVGLLLILGVSVITQAQPCIVETLALDRTNSNGALKTFMDTNEDGVLTWINLLNAGKVNARVDLNTLNLIKTLGGEGYLTLRNKLLNDLDDNNLIKFTDDFANAPTPTLKAFADNTHLVYSWNDLAKIGKKVDGVPQGHALRTNTDFLKKYSDLDVARKTKLKNYLDEQKAFAGKKGEVSYSADRNIDIGGGNPKNYRVDYDEFGFPKFEQYSPNGFNANQNDLASYFTNGKTRLDGGSNDFTAANNWLKNKFPDKDITKTSTGFKLKENGVEIEYTWHHHQNGKDIFPVPRAIHNNRTTVGGSNYFGFPHSGGAALIKTDPAIIGFFPDPIF